MTGVPPEASFGVLPVGGGGRAAPAPRAEAVAAWWAACSFGHWRPRAVPLPPVHLSADPAGWCAAGGMGPGPRNAAGLARRALEALPAGTEAPAAVVIVADAPLAPHAWRVPGGGVAVAPGRWVRRYAALPAGAPLGFWAHELAHLLLGWPDLPDSPCLMGQGARRHGGAAPAPPCPPLAWAAGWLRGRAASPGLRLGELTEAEVVPLDWGGRSLLLSSGPEPGGPGCWLALHAEFPPGPPLGLLHALPAERPLLAAAAPLLAALPPAATCGGAQPLA
ncbi:hypothetical protein LPC08_12655 [Roseomonas sp. OT10]|uniref:hypothetical protein n=1 Tax=Roseomonas cutis TaxID=2897332 RepID=UPI001E5378AF|nr:hypothetical protein [Roseomonas sp. OT10]UFN46880.1 hypothetical protein LPC08_12655 [Roseomonas sp. OT10]